MLRGAPAGKRLGQVADRHCTQGGEQARRDDLWAEDENDVGIERLQCGDERAGPGRRSEVEERGLESSARQAERTLPEIDALSDECKL